MVAEGPPVRGSASLPHDCPACKAKALTVSWGLVSKPLGTFSLAGAQLKTSAVEAAAVDCGACGAHVPGRLVNAAFSADGLAFTEGHFEANEAAQAIADRCIEPFLPAPTAGVPVPDDEHGLDIGSGSWLCKCGEYYCPKASLPSKRRPTACPLHGAVLDCADDCEGRTAAVG